MAGVKPNRGGSNVNDVISDRVCCWDLVLSSHIRKSALFLCRSSCVVKRTCLGLTYLCTLHDLRPHRETEGISLFHWGRKDFDSCAVWKTG
jgi:hypothetical protein